MAAKKAIKFNPNSVRVFFLCLFVLSGLAGIYFDIANVSADQLSNRSIVLSTPFPSVIADHTFQFFMPTNDITGSIVFEYCTNSPLLALPCDVPTGLDTSAATLSSQLGNTGFSIDNADTTANKLVISRAPSAAATINTSYVFSNITNPSQLGTIYVRISTYQTGNGSGGYTNFGGVAFFVPSEFNVSAFVPPFLRLCVGLSVAVDCSSNSGDTLDLGDLSANHASAGVSQFSTGTNSPSGYAIYALGTTMTSGNDAITSLGSPTPSFPGNNQFGINLRANSNPLSGQNPSGAGVAVPTASYNVPNQFTFNDGEDIASSNFPSDYNRMTVSYLANINKSQPIGIYSTTITYVATAQF